MFIGARILKTGLAVTISMYICTLFNIQPALFAGAATVLNMQPSVGQSLYNAREQIYVHFTSIFIAIILGIVLTPHPLSMGLSTIIVILICNQFNWRSASAGGIMAAIFILNSPANEFLSHALMRSSAIFIGLAVALIVNLTIAPPRYRQPLVQKLTELNTLITGIFTKAVESYLNVELLKTEEIKEKQVLVENLFKETNRFYDLYRIDLGPLSEKTEGKKEKESQFYWDYLTYNKGLWQRTRDILFLAQERKERRQKNGDIPVRQEFKEILQLLNDALKLYEDHNQELLNKLNNKETPHVEEPRIWSKLDQILKSWQSDFPSNPLYLQALIEVSLITYKIRWAAKESVRLLN